MQKEYEGTVSVAHDFRLLSRSLGSLRAGCLAVSGMLQAFFVLLPAIVRLQTCSVICHMGTLGFEL